MLTSSDQRAIDALVKTRDKAAAYRAGFPLSRSWKEATVTRKAAGYFRRSAIAARVAELSARAVLRTEPKPKRPSRMAGKTRSSRSTTTPARSNGKHPGGRPSKYTDQTLAIVRDYLENFSKVGDSVPSICGLAVILGVARETLHAWARDDDRAEFADVLGMLLAMQERELINKGLSNDFNSTITKLMLANHGYHSASTREHTGKRGGPIETKTITADMTPEEATRIYRAMMRPDGV